MPCYLIEGKQTKGRNFMADNGSGNTAIVAIVVLVLIGLGLAWFFGVFGGAPGSGGGTTKVIEKPTVIEKIEHPSR